MPLLPPALPRFKPGNRPPGIGDWQLVELLGVGGFGEVWKAINPRFDGMPPVALKFCLDPKAQERLLTHEAAILNQVMRHGKHDGIVPLLHTYLSADPPCLAYEYIDGGDLAGLIQARRGGFPPQQAARVVQRLAEIVGFAHRLSPPVVHRDLKPANILMKSRTQGKLVFRITDFGIGGLAVQQAVSQSRRGTTSGEFLTAAWRGAYTPLYASPEQMRGAGRPDPRDDVYSLGVIWYQLLTGDLTKGRPGGEAWRKRLAERGMTPGLLALLASTCEDEQVDRPANGAELAEKLALALQELSPTSPPPISEESPTPDPRQESLEADWRAYEALVWQEQGNEVDFLQLHAPARLDAWRLAAEQGKPEGQVLLGMCHYKGIEAEKDAAEAVRCFRQAAEQGLALGQYVLAERLRGKDITDAVKWYRKAAEQDFVPSQVALGHLYRLGKQIPGNKDEAAKWYGKALRLRRRAAEQGNADAQNRLGIMYAEGLCVAKNDAEAIKWFRKAAEQGVPASQFNLGVRYMEGRGVRRDDAEAATWFHKAAQQDFSPAQAFLGMMYVEGRGVPQDDKEGVKWLESARAQKERWGTFGFGRMVEGGFGPDDFIRYWNAPEQAYAKALKRLKPGFWRRIFRL